MSKPNSAVTLAAVVGFQQEIGNVSNMLFMARGDMFLSYVQQLLDNKVIKEVTYPALRPVILKDLEDVTIFPVKVNDGKNVYPWGKMSPKMKAHSLASAMRICYERRNLKFNREGKHIGEVFVKFQKETKDKITGKTTAAKEVKAVKTITSNSVFKPCNVSRGVSFLEAFIKAKADMAEVTTPAPTVSAKKRTSRGK